MPAPASQVENVHKVLSDRGLREPGLFQAGNAGLPGQARPTRDLIRDRPRRPGAPERPVATDETPATLGFERPALVALCPEQLQLFGLIRSALAVDDHGPPGNVAPFTP